MKFFLSLREAPTESSPSGALCCKYKCPTLAGGAFHLVEPREIEVPQAALRAQDVPTRSPLAGQPLGDDMEFDSRISKRKRPTLMGNVT